MSVFSAICFVGVGLYMLELRRQVRELGEEVAGLHKDFLAEVYIRYGENVDGKE